MTVPTRTDVLIVGGGPAGSLLGCLLARRGIEVLLVEKQTHLDRDFRGETLAAPSVVTLRALGFGPALSAHGYLETSGVTMRMEGREVFHVDYGRFPIGALPIDIPQPALIGIFNDAARGLPNFTYLGGTTLTRLLESDGVVRGAVLRRREGGSVEVRARVVIGADGRFSKVRRESGLAADIQPMARDFLSFKLPRPPEWGNGAELVVDRDKHLVVLPTFPDWLRIGHNLPKGSYGQLRQEGFDAFKAGIARLDDRLAPLVNAHLKSWEDAGFLEIFTAEMRQWARDGLLLIGDASHTATPILGQGVNLAIQDTVCLAPLLAAQLAQGSPDDAIPASAFTDFVASRRAHKSLVTRFQHLQEKALTAHTPVATTLRRTRFRLLDRLPIKYRVFGKVINMPHPVDPADVRTPASSDVPTPRPMTPAG